MRFLTLLAAILGFGYQVKPYPRYLDIGPGWLQGTRLTYFMPYEYDSIGRELQDGNTKKAAPIFEQASRKFPENLAFYLCYIQSYPKAWDTEQKRLASLLATEPNNLTNKAQLGAILYSQWFVSEEAQTGGKKGLKKAIALVEPFWEQSHDPACGVLLVEMHLRGGYTPQEASKIKDELIHRLGGERVYASYLQAKRKKFFGVPPPYNLVPKENQRALLGSIALDWVAFSVRRSAVVSDGGSKVEWISRPPAQERTFQYYEKWGLDLKAHEPKTP